MKSSILLVALALAACSPGDGRPAGNEESRTYQLQGFDSVSAEAGIELILTQGPFAVDAKSHNGDLSRLKVEVRGTELDVSSQGMLSFGRSPTYTVTVSAPKWTAIKATAGVDVKGENLRAEDLTVEASAGVSMNLSGTCRALDVQASAGAAIDASDLKCATADVQASAGAKIDVSATEKVSGSASAGAVIDISGNPPTIDVSNDIASVVNRN
ncbi:MAG: DUF2807 domain-containing protein [Hyphomonadaceae bacterium]|nr:DUF2807 domain-containing protein [Hyphomonadaceae bacterium]